MTEEAKLLKAAEWHISKYYSPIPIKKDSNKDHDKKALIKWAKFQTELSTIDDVKRGFSKTKNQMLAIVTGKRANLTVIDLDTAEAIQSINDMLPDSIEIPTVETPGGGRHYYFQYVTGLPTRSNVLPGVDIRNDGGYIVVPPSIGINGKPYQFLNGSKLGKIQPPQMPDFLMDTLLQAAGMANANSCEHIKNGTNPYNNKNPYIESQHCVNIYLSNFNKVNITIRQKKNIRNSKSIRKRGVS